MAFLFFQIQGPENCYYGDSEVSKLKAARSEKKASEYLAHMLDTYGKGSNYFGMKVLGMRALMVADPDMIKTVLTGHYLKFPKSTSILEC